jgi:hypothetical protein
MVVSPQNLAWESFEKVLFTAEVAESAEYSSEKPALLGVLCALGGAFF